MVTSKARSPLTGLSPALASVAPMTARVPGVDQHRVLVDQHRVLSEVSIDSGVDLLAQHAERPHEMGDRTVAVTRGAFGLEDRLVRGQRASREQPEPAEQPGGPLGGAGAGEQARRHDGSGVDHRIEGAAAQLSTVTALRTYLAAICRPAATHGIAKNNAKKAY
ncbi:MAG: hypothetical protein WKF86_04610 [Acidimicrobiales bacterium]